MANFIILSTSGNAPDLRDFTRRIWQLVQGLRKLRKLSVVRFKFDDGVVLTRDFGAFDKYVGYSDKANVRLGVHK
jgi:hypothetical protein